MATVDEIGPWSRKKLELLGKYLVAYTSIMNTPKIQSWCEGCYYIDAFAGSVTPWDREMQQYIDGSPKVALKTYPSFNGYDFMEIKPGRVSKNLLPLRKEFPDKQINIHHGDCNKVIKETILPKYSNYPMRCRKRGFVFLDPYGLELDWETVEAIGKAGVFDVFINFSVMGVTRQCSDKPPTGEDKAKIDRLMGAEDWISELYTDNQQLMLPGFESEECRMERMREGVTEKLVEYYRNRLKTCFKEISRAIIMRNSMNGPMYALILASQHRLAVVKMHEIFDRDKKRSGN
jgi:three-Cys-motif partner protein